MTVIFKRLFDIYGIGFKEGSVPTDFITQVVYSSLLERITEAEVDLMYFSVNTSNSLTDMMEWDYPDFKVRSTLLKKMIKNKSKF